MTQQEWDQLLADWKAKQFAPVQKTAFADAFRKGSDVDEGGGAMLVSGLQQSAWVYSCITKLAEEVSAIRFRFLTGSEENESVIEGGPLVDLFNQPNEWTNRFEFWELILFWLNLRGRSFVLATDKSNQPVPLLPGRSKNIAKLYVLPSDQVRADVRDHTLNGWDYRASHSDPVPSFFFQRDELLMLRFTNPFEPWEGLSPLAVARIAAQTDYAAGKFMEGVMKNNADTGLIVTTDQQPDDDQRLQIEAALKQRRRQSGRTPPPLFLWGGAKVEKPLVSNVDLQFLENRKFSRQEICAIFKVPQEILGFTEDANRSVSDAMILQFIQGRIAPLCAQLEAPFDRIIKAIDPRARGEFHVKGHPVMQAAQRARWDTGMKMFQVGVPLNTINKTLDLGLPKLKHGDKSFLPYSLTEVGEESEQPAKPNTPKEPVNEMARIFEILIAPQRLAPTAERKLLPHVCAPNAGEYAASIAGSEKLKEKKLRRFFVEQQGRVLAALESKKSILDAPTVKGDAMTRASFEVDDIFNMGDENARLWKSMEKLLRGDLEFGFAQIGEELGLADINIPPEDAIRWLEGRQNKLNETVNETTFDALKEAVKEGLGAGDTTDELTARVKEVFADATDRRAETIATTETNTAINSSRQMAMEEVGVERKGWGASNLEGVRASHLANESLSNSENGIPIDDLWPNGLAHPCDPSGAAAEVINCRCYGYAIVGGKAIQPKRFLYYITWTARQARKDGTL